MTTEVAEQLCDIIGEVIYVPGFYDKLGLKEDEAPRRKESGASKLVRNKKSEERAAESSNMETEEFAEELNAGLNAMKGNITNLETGTKIRGKVIDLEPNTEVINSAKNLLEIKER